MGLCDDVRRNCAEIARNARWVRIDLDRIGNVEPGPDPALDAEDHYLDGSREAVAAYLLALDSVNFGSGWFPTLRKRPDRSGYATVASALADRWRRKGAWGGEELRAMDAATIAATLGQQPGHPLMALYACALRELGAFLRDRPALACVDAARGSAERLAEQVLAGMPSFVDPGFAKRAQILGSDLALAGVAEFRDLDRLTIFADNVVPHVLRVDGVLRYEPELAEHIDRGERLEPGEQEREIRGSAVHACELIATELGVAPRTLDAWLWNRGRQPRYKAIPRHRTRTAAY
jgi:hypothetical protein